ncbi:MAG TPA: hypothetical protein VF135_02680 [Terriglobales bacterium]
MFRATKFVLIALLTITQLSLAQSGSAEPSRQQGGTSPAPGTVNAAPQSSLIRILTPVASQKLADNFTTVRFELINPAAAPGTPNFLIQMDGNDPVTTAQTQQSFTGLAPGAHTITVELVDANRTPIPGGRAAVQFFVSPGNTPTGTPRSGISVDQGRDLTQGSAKFQQPDPQTQPPDGDADLPPASSSLPLISIVGFGILVGGVISAMRTRS